MEERWYNTCQYHFKILISYYIIIQGFGTWNEFEKVNGFIQNEIENLIKLKENFHYIIYMLRIMIKEILINLNEN